MERIYRTKTTSFGGTYWLRLGRPHKLDINEKGMVVGVWVGKGYYLPVLRSTLTEDGYYTRVEMPAERYINGYRSGEVVLV